jgi:hypothetical protein
VGPSQMQHQELAERQDGARPGSGPAPRDDRVLRETRVLSLVIAPFLVLGFGILYLFPGHSRELFAWTIKPQMTAMLLGAAYLGRLLLRARGEHRELAPRAGRLHTGSRLRDAPRRHHDPSLGSLQSLAYRLHHLDRAVLHDPVPGRGSVVSQPRPRPAHCRKRRTHTSFGRPHRYGRGRPRRAGGGTS